MVTTPIVEPNTVWLKPSEFAVRQNKRVRTIQLWCQNGFIIELGFLLHRDSTGNWFIGVPLHHPSHAQFA